MKPSKRIREIYEDLKDPQDDPVTIYIAAIMNYLDEVAERQE